MIRIKEEKISELKKLAKLLAVEGVRNNTDLEDLHAGTFPSSKTGDFTDVKVISPYGEIEWSRVSRINDEEIRALMLSIEEAVEKVLIGYEQLDNDRKKAVLEYIMTQRSYDCPDYNSHIRECC